MNPTRRFLLAAAIMVAGGLSLVCYGPRLIAQDRERLQLLRARQATLTTELQEVRRDSSARRSALSQAQQELALLPLPSATASKPARAAIEAASQAWFSRLQGLQALIAQQPSLGLPELQLLSQRDWLLVAQDAELDTEEHIRRSLAALRNLAKSRFMPSLGEAVRKYLATHDSQLPTTLQDLNAYLEPKVDDSVLARYEIVRPGNVSQGSATEVLRVFIREKAPVDVKYEMRRGLDAKGWPVSGDR